MCTLGRDRTALLAVGLATLLLGNGFVGADVLNMDPGFTSLATVPVADAGNAGELSGTGAGGWGPNRFCGSVSYAYRIGKFEVTAAQYCEFLNAVAKTDTYGLYNANMASSSGCRIQRSGDAGDYAYSVPISYANRPVNYVSWGDAARFANWLHNDQPTGAQELRTTEDGAYYLDGATSDVALMAVQRETDWRWALTSEDEWYKAAYFDPDKPGGPGYYDYPTGTNTVPSNARTTPDGGNNANYYDGVTTLGTSTVVGEYELSESPYGTFDQGGNFDEWTEAVVYANARGLRGGSFLGEDVYMKASARNSSAPTTELYRVFGFRVVTLPDAESLIFGDASGDGRVDQTDAERVAANWGRSDATWQMGDFSRDGTIGASDAAIFAANWGHGTSEGTIPGVPEPCLLVSVTTGVLTALGFKTRCREN